VRTRSRPSRTVTRPARGTAPSRARGAPRPSDAELVTTKKNGRVRECRLGPARLDDVAGWIEAHRVQWERRLNRLEAVLKERKGESR
jgi:hypothetical protein